jgi:putative transposase
MPRSVNWRSKTIFVTRAEAMSPTERKAMIRKDLANLSLTKQCKLLKISRSSLYYVPIGVECWDAETDEIDRVFTNIRSSKPPDRGLLCREMVSCWPSPCASADGHHGPTTIYKAQTPAKKTHSIAFTPTCYGSLPITR